LLLMRLSPRDELLLEDRRPKGCSLALGELFSLDFGPGQKLNQ